MNSTPCSLGNCSKGPKKIPLSLRILKSHLSNICEKLMEIETKQKHVPQLVHTLEHLYIIMNSIQAQDWS